MTGKREMNDMAAEYKILYLFCFFSLTILSLLSFFYKGLNSFFDGKKWKRIAFSIFSLLFAIIVFVDMVQKWNDPSATFFRWTGG